MQRVTFMPAIAIGIGWSAVASVAAQTIPTPLEEHSAMWSPDGKRLVFVSNRTGNNQIYVMNVDGSDVRRLTRSGAANDEEPSWSPDGTSIAFCSDRDGNNEIYVMDADGRNPRNLTNHPASDCAMPSWWPDGQRLVVVSNRDGDWQANAADNYEIYVMNADGSNQTRVTHTPGYDLSTGHAWTPDGKQIIFCSTNEVKFDPDARDKYRDFDIYRIDIAGTGLTRLTFTTGEDSYPYLSPDGSLIYFTRQLQSTGTSYDCIV